MVAIFNDITFCLVNVSTSEVQFKDYIFFETFLISNSPSWAGIVFPLCLHSHSTIHNSPVALNNFYCIICSFVFSLGLCALWIPDIYLIHLCHVQIASKCLINEREKKQWVMKESHPEWCPVSTLVYWKVAMRDIKVVILWVKIYWITTMLQVWWLLSMHYHYSCNIHSNWMVLIPFHIQLCSSHERYLLLTPFLQMRR